MKETEIKFPVKNLQSIRDRLKKEGAHFETGFFEDNIVFDDQVGTLFKKREILRLRRSNDVVLTFKKPVEKERFKVMEEYEVKVSDFNETYRILTGLGYKKAFRYQKRRDIFHFLGTEVLLDRTPIGDYVEIEGEKEKIMEVCRHLGLSIEAGTAKNYLELYRDHCRKRDIKPGDMVF